MTCALLLVGCSSGGGPNAVSPPSQTFNAPSSTVFAAVSAGDVTSQEAVLWARVRGTEAVDCTALIATDPSFQTVVRTLTSPSVPANANTVKMAVTGLSPSTHYWYCFQGLASRSITGQLRTLPAPTAVEPFKIGFSGDADQRFRPYPAMANFGTALNLGSVGLNAFIFLGDIIYERNDANGLPGFGKGSPYQTPSGTSGPDVAIAALDPLNTRYLANISGVNADGTIADIPSAGLQTGLQRMFAAAAQYALIDNHEIFGSLQSGGAALQSLKENVDDAYAVNRTGAYNNKTVGFLAETKAFYNNLPTSADIQGSISGGDAMPFGLTVKNLLHPTEATISAPRDPRTDGTARNWFSRRWGRNVTYIQLDDRSYRDARMVAPADNPLTPPYITRQPASFDSNGSLDPSQWTSPNNCDPKPGVYQSANSSPDRTMLGETQLAWFKSQVLAAHSEGARWIVIALSTPIDQSGPQQDSKSWAGGYPAARNELLKFLVDNQIRNVVFLTTDDHNFRVTPLQYQPDPINQPLVWAPVPGAFQLLAGPMGAGGPNDYATPESRTFANIQQVTAQVNGDLADYRQPLIGLVGYAGLTNVFRAGDPTASTAPQSADFYVPDQFGYTTLAWDADANLTVECWSLDSYQPNTYPATSAIPHRAFAFTVKPGP